MTPPEAASGGDSRTRPAGAGTREAAAADGAPVVDAAGTGRLNPAVLAEPRALGTAGARDPLAREVRLLGALLGQVIAEQEGTAALALVERVRTLAIASRRARGASAPAADPGRPGDLDRILARQEPRDLGVLARAFSLFFQLVNLAEEKARVRDLRRRARRARRSPLEDSVLEAVLRLSGDRDGPERTQRLVGALRISPVLTAHPTEARRRTVLVALRRVYALLDELDDPRLTPAQDQESRRRLREEITVLWRTADLRQARPSPLDEVRSAMVIFDATLFTVTPRLYRAVDAALDGVAAGGPGRGPATDAGRTGTRPPRVPAFLHWGSWIGADRDGHPLVTAETTIEAARIQADHLLHGYEAVATRLMTTTAARPAGALAPAVERRLARDVDELPEAMRELEERFPWEPYRRRFGAIAERLSRTRAYLAGVPGPQAGRYGGPEQLLAELDELRDALITDGLARVAFGGLADFRWQVETFGFHLASLEVRQHAAVHRAALAELRLPEPDLDRELTPGVSVAEVLASFRAMAAIQRRSGEDACRRAVVSFTASATDAINVLALAAAAAGAAIPAAATAGLPPAEPALDVVPLLETAGDLEGAGRILAALLADPMYRDHLRERGDRQEVMLGYSDSNKESGYIAANWLLYRAQEGLVAVARAAGVELTIFHGRGGAIGRGGGPSHRAVLAAPAGAVDGRLKLTEQGEVIAARYGNAELALRALEQAVSATLLASAPEHAAALEAAAVDGAAIMDELAASARDAYRSLVWEHPAFEAVFSAATPIVQVSGLYLGSRPAARVAAVRAGGLPAGAGARASATATIVPIASLRAIPWVFAWSQVRLDVPGWYGLGTALERFAQAHGASGMRRLRRLYERWPFVRVLLQNAEVALARSDPAVGRRAFDAVGPDGVRIGEAIAAEHARASRVVLKVTGHAALLEASPEMQRSLVLRAPYLDALSKLQAVLLARLRQAAADGVDERTDLERLVGQTISGIAAGVQGTG